MSQKQQYDVTVIGGGPGGYVAAIRAAQLGFKVALVEKHPTLGGTCLNVGCIPSKALLDSSEHYLQAKHHLGGHGITFSDLSIDVSKMMARKNKIVTRLTSGLDFLMKRHKIDVWQGHGALKGVTKVSVQQGDGEVVILPSRNTIIASGSVPVALPVLPFDGKRVVSSTEALAFEKVPRRLVVVGAGAIGLELGSVWLRFGSEVTVVEWMDAVLPGADRQVSKELERVLRKQGMQFSLKTRVTGGKRSGRGVVLMGVNAKGEDVTFPADVILVAVGRRPFLDGLNLGDVGVSLESGRIGVNAKFQTSVPSIYAIGDVIHGPMLAHKAEEEGVAVAEILAGQPGHVARDTIPSVVYTWPEVAWVGETEQSLKANGVDYRSGVFGFKANGRALCMDAPDGFVKILADKATDRVLGGHIVGPWASDLLTEIVTVMAFGGSAEDIARTIHAHPTLSEGVKEAALSVDSRALHAV